MTSSQPNCWKFYLKLDHYWSLWPTWISWCGAVGHDIYIYIYIYIYFHMNRSTEWFVFLKESFISFLHTCMFPACGFCERTYVAQGHLHEAPNETRIPSTQRTNTHSVKKIIDSLSFLFLLTHIGLNFDSKKCLNNKADHENLDLSHFFQKLG